MKATPLLVRWHEDNAPIYSAAFETGPKGRLATAGGDNRVRLWKIEGSGDDRRVEYLSSLVKHTQAVNVVRWCPRGEMLGSAGDDGNVLLWVPSENPALHARIGEDAAEEKEVWRVKTMCRSSGSEIYDLAWSPDGVFFITGSMDNVARIYNASNEPGTVVRQIAEHNHYVQGVAWDPLSEYIATQSSDRSVHIYTLKNKDGQFNLAQHNKITKMEMPSRRISSNSPAPPDFRGRSLTSEHVAERAIGSPGPSAPGTPQSLALPMNPPLTTHSRRSSFGSSIRRSVSPSPSLPLPAVMPSASPGISGGVSMAGPRSTSLYANETFTSFFRRLTFSPDGSLLFTPAGQQKEHHHGVVDKSGDDMANMTYIYTRAGLNKPPVAKLPGHRKPSLAVRCSPIYYTLRSTHVKTREIAIDTGNDGDLSPLPEPIMETKPHVFQSSMDPPPPVNAPSPAQSFTTAPSPRQFDIDHSPVGPPPGPPPVFDLPYRMVYGVATQDAVYVYDTQQKQPLCVVSNLHYATFTDLTWSTDGSMLLISSSDGFCSCLTFGPGELGTVWQAPPPLARHSVSQATPSHSNVTATGRPASSHGQGPTQSPFMSAQPASPARSMSISSVTTQELHASLGDHQSADARSASSQTPQISSIPSLTAASASGLNAGGLPMFTPPQTPGSSMAGASTLSNSHGSTAPAGIAGLKREGEEAQSSAPKEKRRRIQPTLISGGEGITSAAPAAPTDGAAAAQAQE
ncbi:hypothetical protein ANO11243_064880 [Dothideomycetidae sp. 11243]|nr:hypothetical protein ANO11243_064880 [fungal sp. No.11243]